MEKIAFNDWASSSLFPDSSDIPTRDANTSRKTAKKEVAPDPENPRQIVKPIASGQFAPFTTFFVSVSQAHNLANCSNISVLVKVRVHPAIPIVETPSVWCANREADFHFAYAFDFTQIPPFNLGDFTPVLELYKRYTKRPELVAVALLPLSVTEVVECAGSTLTFLYRNRSIILKDVVSGRRMGSLVVTVAMGFPEHERYLDPNSQFVTTPKFTPNVVVAPVNQPNIPPPRQITGAAQPTVVYSTSVRKQEVYEEEVGHRRRSQHRKKKESKYDWVDEALQLGWKPPGSTDFDWKAKAREKGWIPPSEQVRSSVGVTCDPNMRGLRQIADVQTDPVRLDNDESELIGLLNAKKKKKPKKKQVKLSLDVPHILFEEPVRKTKPVLNRVPCLTLISQAPLERANVDEEFSSSEQQELHSEIQEMISMTHQSLANFPLSSESDDDTTSQDLSQECEYVSTEEEMDGFFRRQDSDSSDAGSILKKIARNDPELLKMIEMVDTSSEM